MIPISEHCPLDLTVSYCPRCDVAFAFLSTTGVETPPSVLEWHRSGSRLELRAEDQPRWRKLPQQFQKCWGANIPHHVGLFLRGRHSERLGCPMDGCRVPVLHRWQDGTGTRWLLTWCRWCAMGFLFAADPDYGWEHCADLT